MERNYRVELVHKRYNAKCLVTSVHRNVPKDMGNDDLIVRAGAVWSGVGTLAVALGGCNVSGREDDHALFAPSLALCYTSVLAVALGDTMCRGERTIAHCLHPFAPFSGPVLYLRYGTFMGTMAYDVHCAKNTTTTRMHFLHPACRSS